MGANERSNKGMKPTSVERIGRSQLIPGVRRTVRHGDWNVPGVERLLK